MVKYAEAGSILTGHPGNDAEGCLERLIATLEEWTMQLEIPLLGRFGMNAGNIDGVVNAADNKQSPVRLDRTVMRDIQLIRI